MQLPNNIHLMVLDEKLELPFSLMTPNSSHCRTEEEVDYWLTSIPDHEPVILFLNEFEAVTKLVNAHEAGYIDIVIAYIIADDPEAIERLGEIMEDNNIDYADDANGALIGMKVAEALDG